MHFTRQPSPPQPSEWEQSYSLFVRKLFPFRSEAVSAYVTLEHANPGKALCNPRRQREFSKSVLLKREFQLATGIAKAFETGIPFKSGLLKSPSITLFSSWRNSVFLLCVPRIGHFRGRYHKIPYPIQQKSPPSGRPCKSTARSQSPRSSNMSLRTCFGV